MFEKLFSQVATLTAIVRNSAATGFSVKITRFSKKFTRSEKNH